MPVGKLAKDWGDNAAGTVITTDREEAGRLGHPETVLVAGVRFDYLRSNNFLAKGTPRPPAAPAQTQDEAPGTGGDADGR